MRQAGVCACLIIRCLLLVVELQRKLNVPWRLSAVDLSHVGAKAHIGCVKLDVVKRVDEIGSELQLEPFREKEVLMQTQVHIGVMRSSQTSELWGAVAKRPGGWVGEIAVVGEPLVTTDPWERGLINVSFPRNRWEATAIRSRTARERAGLISGIVNRHREAGAE